MRISCCAFSPGRAGPGMPAAFPLSHQHLLPQVCFDTSPQPVPCQGSAVPAMLPAPSLCFQVLQLLPTAVRLKLKLWICGSGVVVIPAQELATVAAAVSQGWEASEDCCEWEAAGK